MTPHRGCRFAPDAAGPCAMCLVDRYVLRCLAISVLGGMALGLLTRCG